jgi:hypothetical protein
MKTSGPLCALIIGMLQKGYKWLSDVLKSFLVDVTPQ